MSIIPDDYREHVSRVDWPLCSVGGCSGVRIRDRCAVHARPDDSEELLRFASAGTIDLRGCAINARLLGELIDALPTSGGRPELRVARFRGAEFVDEVSFDDVLFGQADFAAVRFSGDAHFSSSAFETAYFDGCRFNGRAWFERVVFQGGASFVATEFASTANFRGARFLGVCDLDRAHFERVATFVRAQFHANLNGPAVTFDEAAHFEGAYFGRWVIFTDSTFADGSQFAGAEFDDGVRFDGCRFGAWADFSRASLGREAGFEDSAFGPESRLLALRAQVLTFAGALLGDGCRITVASASSVSFQGCTVDQPTEMSVSADAIDLRDLLVLGGGTFEAGGAAIRLEGARFADPTTIAGDAVDDFGRPKASISSLRRADVANLVVADLDLSDCSFRGAHHLDQIRIEGRSAFAESRAGWSFTRRWPFLEYRTRRQMIAEEIDWRLLARGTNVGDLNQPDEVAQEIGARALPEEVIPFLRMLRDRLEAHERVTLTDEALVAAYEHATTIVPARMVARRALDLLSEAALVARQVDSREPEELVALREEIEAVRVEKEAEIERQQFEAAASLRDRERTLTGRAGMLTRDWLVSARDTGTEQPEVGAEEIARVARLNLTVAPKPRRENHRGELRASDVAEIYRLLRKSREDKRDEPGAADFYYGEMEMRRLGRGPASPERWLLTAYWVLAGYALRPSRSFGWLLLTLVIAIPLADRYAFAKSHSWSSTAVFVVGTGLLRGPSVALTTGGELIQVSLRVVGAVLAALTLLGMRGRVRR